MTDTESYRQEKLTIDLVWANIFSLLILIPIVLIYGLPFYYFWSDELSLSGIRDFFRSHPHPLQVAKNIFLLILTLFTGIVLHELIHGLVWARYARNGFRSIKFGVLKTMLTPYCHCKEPLKVKHYILGAIMPAIVLGFIPGLLSIFIGSIALLIFGIFFTMAASGDFLVIHLLRKERMDDLVMDHPSEAGCYIYRDSPSENKKV